jgi:hypothetical protein
MVEKLWGFEDFSPSLGMLSATVNARKSAQNRQNLPKSVSTVWFFNPRIFHMLFLLSKNGLFM